LLNNSSTLIDRLIGAANMFDILPASAVPADVPLTDGGPANQITNFTSGMIWRHSWSRDGKYLALARGNFSVDAVMLTDLR